MELFRYYKELDESNPVDFTLKLFPIDHGLSFPDCFDAQTYDMIWMRWPQSKQPFSP